VSLGVLQKRNSRRMNNFRHRTVEDGSNLPIERIGFGPASRFDIRQNEVAWFLADKWAPFQRLTVDLGLRFDRDSVTDSTNAAPRAGFALMLTRDAKTLFKGGVGLFYDRVPLNIASFPFLPAARLPASLRRETPFPL
jgi:outer membrane receptor protein involved in Fe transport